MELENVPFLGWSFLFLGDSTNLGGLGFLGCDKTSVCSNKSTILFPKGRNSDRYGSVVGSFEDQVEWDKGFGFGGSDGNDFGGWNGECHGRLFNFGCDENLGWHDLT
jgi:hypothetical protein